MHTPGHQSAQSAYREIYDGIMAELMTLDVEGVHFSAEYFRERPINHDVICAVIDSGREATAAEIGWYLTGDTVTFLEPQEWFGDTAPMPGAVTEEQLQTIGTYATEAVIPVFEESLVAGD